MVKRIKGFGNTDPDTKLAMVDAFPARISALQTRLGGLSIVNTTEAKYEEMSSYDASTLYICKIDDNNINLYLGSIPING